MEAIMRLGKKTALSPSEQTECIINTIVPKFSQLFEKHQPGSRVFVRVITSFCKAKLALSRVNLPAPFFFKKLLIAIEKIIFPLICLDLL